MRFGNTRDRIQQDVRFCPDEGQIVCPVGLLFASTSVMIGYCESDRLVLPDDYVYFDPAKSISKVLLSGALLQIVANRSSAHLARMESGAYAHFSSCSCDCILDFPLAILDLTVPSPVLVRIAMSS